MRKPSKGFKCDVVVKGSNYYVWYQSTNETNKHGSWLKDRSQLRTLLSTILLESNDALNMVSTTLISTRSQTRLTSWKHVASNAPSLPNIFCVTTPLPSPAHGLSISVNIHSSALTAIGSWK